MLSPSREDSPYTLADSKDHHSPIRTKLTWLDVLLSTPHSHLPPSQHTPPIWSIPRFPVRVWVCPQSWWVRNSNFTSSSQWNCQNVHSACQLVSAWLLSYSINKCLEGKCQVSFLQTSLLYCPLSSSRWQFWTPTLIFQFSWNCLKLCLPPWLLMPEREMWHVPTLCLYQSTTFPHLVFQVLIAWVKCNYTFK